MHVVDGIVDTLKLVAAIKGVQRISKAQEKKYTSVADKLLALNGNPVLEFIIAMAKDTAVDAESDWPLSHTIFKCIVWDMVCLLEKRYTSKLGSIRYEA